MLETPLRLIGELLGCHAQWVLQLFVPGGWALPTVFDGEMVDDPVKGGAKLVTPVAERGCDVDWEWLQGPGEHQNLLAAQLNSGLDGPATAVCTGEVEHFGAVAACPVYLAEDLGKVRGGHTGSRYGGSDRSSGIQVSPRACWLIGPGVNPRL